LRVEAGGNEGSDPTREPVGEPARRDAPRPHAAARPAPPGDSNPPRDLRDLRRHGLPDLPQPRGRDGRVQFRTPEHAPAPPGPDRQVRIRSSYFPFTEPSIEVDIDWPKDDPNRDRLTKGTGWLEILGAGMVHPTVLKNGGYDPDKVTGFAFGMGPQRMLMLKH